MSKFNELFHHIQFFLDVPVYFAIILQILFISSKYAFVTYNFVLISHTFLSVIYSCDAKLNFQHNFSSLQCHVILQKSF